MAQSCPIRDGRQLAAFWSKADNVLCSMRASQRQRHVAAEIFKFDEQHVVHLRTYHVGEALCGEAEVAARSCSEAAMPANRLDDAL